MPATLSKKHNLVNNFVDKGNFFWESREMATDSQSCCWTKDEYGNKCGKPATWMATKHKQPYCDKHATQMRKLNATLEPLPPNEKASHER